jgi:hypothetical protein
VLENRDVDTALVRENAVIVVLRALIPICPVAADILSIFSVLQLCALDAFGRFLGFGGVLGGQYPGDEAATGRVQVELRERTKR